MIIKGTGFADGATVTFGGVAATSVVTVDAFTITCLTPAHAVGKVDVTVTNPDAQFATLHNGYAYSQTWKGPNDQRQDLATQPGPNYVLDNPVFPSVTSIVPSSGVVAGGTPVYVIGTNFVSGATVTFGGIPVTETAYVNSKALWCVTPADTVGPVDIIVTNPDGQTGLLILGYTYIQPPIILTSVTPLSGPTTGGTGLAILGFGFFPGANVNVGGLTGASVTVVNSQEVTATAPAHTEGPAEIQVANNQ